MRNDVIELQTSQTSIVIDDIGDTNIVPIYKEIFAERKSIKQSEFYQAHTAGLKPEMVFLIHPSEYEEKTGVRYNNKQYKVIRTYEKDCETLELVVEGDIHGITI